MPDSIRIIKQDEEITVGERGELRTLVRVSFKVDDDGPFLERFPRETFSATAARARLDEFARELRALRGLL